MPVEPYNSFEWPHLIFLLPALAGLFLAGVAVLCLKCGRDRLATGLYTAAVILVLTGGAAALIDEERYYEGAPPPSVTVTYSVPRPAP